MSGRLIILSMIVAIDVLYSESSAMVAAVQFEHWQSDDVVFTHTLAIEDRSEYIPGKFYLRELASILAILKEIDNFTTLVIDGYCHLNECGKKGLGAYLFDATKERYPIIGVAKKPFKNSLHATPVYWGNSKKPLYVTSIGIEQDVAASHISSMVGSYWVPTLLKQVDSLSRGN